MTMLRTLRPVSWLQLAVAIALGVSGVVGGVEPSVRDRLAAYAFIAMGAPTLLALWHASRASTADPESRLVWRDLLLATGVWYAGDIMSTYFDLTSPRYVLSTADVAYLGSIPLAMRALARFPGLGASQATRMRVQIDVSVAFVSVATVFYLFSPLELAVVGPAGRATGPASAPTPGGRGCRDGAAPAAPAPPAPPPRCGRGT